MNRFFPPVWLVNCRKPKENRGNYLSTCSVNCHSKSQMKVICTSQNHSSELPHSSQYGVPTQKLCDVKMHSWRLEILHRWVLILGFNIVSLEKNSDQHIYSIPITLALCFQQYAQCIQYVEKKSGLRRYKINQKSFLISRNLKSNREKDPRKRFQYKGESINK